MGLRRSVLMMAAVAAAVAATSGCTASGTTAGAGAGGLVANPYIADARVGEHASVFAGGDGDLWPNCWAKDGDVYAAYGDGKGFGDEASDIGVARISGAPLPRSTNDGSGHGSSGHGASLNGTTLAVGDGVGQVWSGDDFTRKPTA